MTRYIQTHLLIFTVFLSLIGALAISPLGATGSFAQAKSPDETLGAMEKAINEETLSKVADIVREKSKEQLAEVLKKSEVLKNNLSKTMYQMVDDFCQPEPGTTYETRSIGGVDFKYKDSPTCVFAYWFIFWLK
jgi:hypothetical protein